MILQASALGQIIRPAPPRRASSGTYPILSMTMHGGLVDQAAKFRKRVASTDTSQYKVVMRNQLVVGFPIDEGVLSVQDLYAEAIVSPAYTIWDIAEQADPTYLEKYLRSPAALTFYTSKLRGTTARRRTLPTDLFLALPVPLPPIQEQRRIAELMNRAGDLRVKRRASLVLLDELRQSMFVDMFGDVVGNDRDWPRARVGDFVAGFESGKSLVADDEEDQASSFRVLKVSAVTSLRFRAEESKAVPVDYEPPAGHLVREGDLLFSRANTAELVGATALATDVPPNLLLSDKLWRFMWPRAPRSDPLFVRQLFQQPEFRREVSRRATGTSGSMKNVSQPKVLSISVGLPPLEAQTSFASRVEIVDETRSTVEMQSPEFDALFAALQHRGFCGEL